jgi:hypothetical protein
MTIDIKKLESIVAEKPQLDGTRVYRHSDPDKASGILLNKWLSKPKPVSLPETERGIGDLIKDLFKGLKSEDPNVREEKLNELRYFKNLADVYFPKDNRFYRILATMWDAYGNELSEGL